LHAVDPNRASSSVRREPQFGQRISARANAIGRAAFGAPCRGGAMPNAASLRLASGAIQPLLQGGERTVTIRTGASVSLPTAARTSLSITRVAGHPEYVGVSVTMHSPSVHATSRTMPSSTTETTGISGSTTPRSARQMAAAPP